MIVAVAVVAMIATAFRCRKVIVWMCVFISPVEDVAVRMVEYVCVFSTVFTNCAECETFDLNNAMMHVSFRFICDCGYRVVIVEKVVGFVGLIIFDTYRKIVLK
jgi:hypothetical protein